MEGEKDTVVTPQVGEADTILLNLRCFHPFGHQMHRICQESENQSAQMWMEWSFDAFAGR